MIEKQDLIQELVNAGQADEDVLAIINKYPDQLSDADADKLDAELQSFAADNELLAKAYDELATEFDEHAQDVVETMDKAVTKVAKDAYQDLKWANEMTQS